VVQSISAGLSIAGNGERPGASDPGVLTLSAVSTGRFCPDAAKAIPPEQAARYSVYARKDTVLISRSNTLDLVGAAVYVDANFPQRFLSDLIWEIHTDTNSLSPRFLVAYLQSPIGRRHIRAAASGTSGSMKKISMGRLRAVPIALPDLAIQEHLANVDHAMSRVHEELDRLIGAKSRLRDGLAQALLTGQRRLPAFTGREWREVRIGEVMQEVHRPVEWDDEAVYDLVSVRRWAGGVYTRQQLRGGDIKVKKLRRIQSGDILISHIQSPYGAMAMVGDDHDGHCVSDLYSVLVPRRGAKIVPRYFAWLCRTRWMWHQAYVSSNGFLAERLRVNFDPATFLDRVIRIPESPDEQSAIADVLDAATRELDALTRLREAVAKQKRGLMQQLLTGRLRVPEEMNR